MSQNNSNIAITKAPLHSKKKRARAISSAPLKPPDDPPRPQNTTSQDASDTTTATTAQLHQINIDFNPRLALSPGGESIENVTDCTQAVPLTAKNSSSTVNYKLNALLSHANNSSSAELAAVLELCNKLSAVLDLILCTYENSLPRQTAVLRQAMGHGIAKAIKGLTTESKPTLMYATAATAKAIPSNNPSQAVPATGQPHKKQVQLPAAHAARDLDPQAICEQVHAMIPDLTWITDVWHCPLGITVAAPSPVKAASILEHADKLKAAESWTTFVVSSIKKSTHSFKGQNITLIPVSEEMLLSEIQGAAHQAPITCCHWTKKSMDPNLHEGYVWVGV
ncbi:hypothetical protein ACO22_07736 [Paracoccidioides brasiliensis]|uniref:Uncharacterized protein n=1 Tax=Paracoccidioides brasiliensis TaxID=121759 RepID=A0A1D2J3T8_PARBR|nr:hypothetical protein ACO22_07736 [Paracoccidioides brasiliensis]